jgi:CRP-like cAMP-binding protein
METLITFLRSLRAISDEDAKTIASFFQPRHFKESDYLFHGGSVCDELFFVVAGVLRIVGVNERGVDVTHYFIRDGQFCTLLQSFTNGTVAEDSIQASSDIAVLVIGKGRLLELYERLPFMTELIDRVHQQRLLEKIRLKNIFSGEDSTGRYTLFLKEQPDIAHRVPLNHVASYLHVTPQSLSRIRRNVK